ncbi:MAG: hypothetical protein U0936_21490 [Planctomycetaceae bacterium]
MLKSFGLLLPEHFPATWSISRSGVLAAGYDAGLEISSLRGLYSPSAFASSSDQTPAVTVLSSSGRVNSLIPLGAEFVVVNSLRHRRIH